MNLYIYFSVHEELFHEIAQRLVRDHSVREISGFVYGKDQLRPLRRGPVSYRHLDVFTDWMREAEKLEPDLDLLRVAETKYGRPTFSMMVHGDRLLSGWPHHELLRIIQITVQRFEERFSNHPPDALILESVGDLISHLLHAIADAHSIPTILVDSGRVAGNSIVYHNAYARWDQVAVSFEEMKTTGLARDARQKAADFVQAFRTERPQYNSAGRRFVPGLPLKDFGRAADELLRRRRDKRNPQLTSAARLVQLRTKRLFRDRASRIAGIFEQPIANERYVLFPLHFQPEATTLIAAPLYLDQLALIEDISKSLPVGYRLYVKEHFASLGRRPLRDYRRLRQLWNVRLIDPFIRGTELVDSADAVATITSTMGWEALLLGKPVLSFGEVFYNRFPLVVRGDLVPKGEWPRLFLEILENYEHDEELLIRFVAAIQANADGPTVRWDNPRTGEGVMTEENLRAITDLLAAGLRKSTPALIEPGLLTKSATT